MYFLFIIFHANILELWPFNIRIANSFDDACICIVGFLSFYNPILFYIKSLIWFFFYGNRFRDCKLHLCRYQEFAFIVNTQWNVFHVWNFIEQGKLCNMKIRREKSDFLLDEKGWTCSKETETTVVCCIVFDNWITFYVGFIISWYNNASNLVSFFSYFHLWCNNILNVSCCFSGI